MSKHKHRIKPGHIGGTYETGNVVEVEVNSCIENNVSAHSIWHFCNWQLWGRPEDLMAWKGLAGTAGKEEIINKLHQIGVSRGVETNRRNRTGTFDPNIQRMGGSAVIKQRIEADGNYQSRVGRLGGQKCAEEGIGFCGFSYEQRSAQSKRVASVLYFDPDHPELGHRTATALHRMQTKRGYPNQPENRVKVTE
jgi:hypothetical protein